ncbi:MAG: hypothetical protein U0401_03515 [Anaerolineae bacterium]
MVQLTQRTKPSFRNNRAEAEVRAREAAVQLYQRACLAGWWRRMASCLRRRSSDLLNLNEMETKHRIINRYSVGVQLVALDQIQGSQGRCRDFDRAFYPRQSHSQSRWLRVATARELGIALPPVQLVQVGDIYFVRDGHHRISVARALGQSEIEAEVRVWQI